MRLGVLGLHSRRQQVKNGRATFGGGAGLRSNHGEVEGAGLGLNNKVGHDLRGL